MYGLLIVPPVTDINLAAPALAQQVGGTAYDQRQPLLRNLPFIAAWRDEVAPVRAMAQILVAAGVPAWPIAQAALEVGPPLLAARQFRIDARGITVASRQETAQILWRDVALALPCRADFGEATTTITTTKKQSLARLAMGVPIAGKKVETEQEKSIDHAFFCLVWAKTSQPTGHELLVRLDREGMDFSGLGAAMTGSSTSNYLALLQRVQAAVGPAWEPRLERAGGKIVPISGPPVSNKVAPDRKTTVQTVGSSWETESGVMQAARLLMIAARLRGAGR